MTERDVTAITLMESARTSTRLFVLGAALAAVAMVSVAYLRKVRRDFSQPTTITVGTVVDHGGFLEQSRVSGERFLCWVSYEFTPSDGVPRRNWRMWSPGCGVSRGRPIPVQHVVSNPDVNRPADSEPWFPSSLFFFAAGVSAVVGVIRRRSEESEPVGVGR